MTIFAQPKIVAALRNPAHPGSVIGYSAEGMTYKRNATGWHPFAKVVDGFTLEEVVAIRISQGWTEIDPESKTRQHSGQKERRQIKGTCMPRHIQKMVNRVQ